MGARNYWDMGEGGGWLSQTECAELSVFLVFKILKFTVKTSGFI